MQTNDVTYFDSLDESTLVNMLMMLRGKEFTAMMLTSDYLNNLIWSNKDLLSKIDEISIDYDAIIKRSTELFKKIILHIAGKNHDHQYPHPCFSAAKYGRVDLLEFIFSSGYEFNLEYRSIIFRVVHNIAAENGHFECLKFLKARGFSWNAETCRIAAEFGQLECLKSLHEHGCPMNSICSTAIKYGHLEILEYLYAIGKRFDADMCETAVWYQQFGCLQFIVEHLHQNSSIGNAYQMALDMELDDCVNYLKPLLYYGDVFEELHDDPEIDDVDNIMYDSDTNY